jgi:hypothetical protein
VVNRASFIAPSIASAPELVKKTLAGVPGRIFASRRSASSISDW